MTTKGTYNTPVAVRTLLERSTLRRYQRYRDLFSVENYRLYFKGKRVLCESKCKRIIIQSYRKSKGIGARGLYQLVKRSYSGVSESMIMRILSKLPDYQKKNAKFPNKAPLKHVCSSSVHDILQIDLVDMQREAIVFKKEKCKYILSVMDIFSRFVWLRAIPSKSADIITHHLSLIFTEFGKPKIIQHDRGREFDGEVKRLLRKLDIKNILSRPYHPQSQGKIERMHKTLKQKIAYDLNHVDSCGINWAKQLPEYQRILNNTPKECLAWSTPYEVYYGRDPYNDRLPLNHKQQANKLRDAAKAATIKCNTRTDKAYERSCKTPIYNIGDEILLRYKKKGLLNRRIWVVDGVIQQRSLNTNMYKIKYCTPDSIRMRSERSEEKWYHISDITRPSSDRASLKNKLHRKKYYIPLTSSSQLDNLRSDFGLPMIMNPSGNGNCQFAAVSHQLLQYGVYRSEETLRHDVISFLRRSPALGDRSSTLGENWRNSLLEHPEMYLLRMARNFEYGDQITLQSVSQLYNVQILIVSTINSATTLISPDGGSILSNHIPLLIVGHYPEGAGEHYVSLGYNRDMLESIIDRSPQITWESTSPNTSNVTRNSKVKHRNSATKDYVTPAKIADSPNTDVASPTMDCVTPTSEFSSPTNYVDSQTEYIQSPTNNTDSLATDFASRDKGFDSQTKDFDSPKSDFDPPSTDYVSHNTEFRAPTHEHADSRVSKKKNNAFDRDSSPSMEELRKMVELKRISKQVRLKRNIYLPPEIWLIIINIALTLNPASRYSLQQVNRLFKEIVSKTPTPRLYLIPDRFRNITVSPISVRRIIRIAGSGSGLVQAIRNVIQITSWANAWLFLQLDTFCGWYTIKRIWYRRP